MIFDWIDEQVFRLTGDRLRPPFPPVTGSGECCPTPLLPCWCHCAAALQTAAAAACSMRVAAKLVVPWFVQSCNRQNPHSMHAVLADNAGVGFDGKPVAYAGAKGDPLDVSAAAPPMPLGSALVLPALPNCHCQTAHQSDNVNCRPPPSI